MGRAYGPRKKKGDESKVRGGLLFVGLFTKNEVPRAQGYITVEA